MKYHFTSFLIIFFSFFLVIDALAQVLECQPGAPLINDNLSDACVVCDPGVFDGIVGNTGDYTADYDLFLDNVMGTIENNGWIGFVAASQEIMVQIKYNNCSGSISPTLTGVQALITSFISDDDFSIVVHDGFGSVSTNDSLFLWGMNLTVGEIYYLMIDGFAGSSCDFEIELISGEIGEVPVGSLGTIVGPDTLCPLQTMTYQFGPVSGASYSTWVLPEGVTINGENPATVQLHSDQPTIVDVDVSYEMQGSMICVTPWNSCTEGEETCFPVVLEDVGATVLDTMRVCYGEEFDWIDGNSYTADSSLNSPLGMYLNDDGQGCGDSLVLQEIEIHPTLQDALPDMTFFSTCDSSGIIKTICNPNHNYMHEWTTSTGITTTDSCFLFSNDVDYPVVLTTTDLASGCTKESTFSMVAPLIDIVIDSIVDASSANSADGSAFVSVYGYPTGWTFQWFNNGVLVSQSEDIGQVLPGTYDLVVTNPVTNCSEVLVVTIGFVVAGNEPILATDMRLYPNPSSGIFYLEMPRGDYDYIVTNMIGVELLSGKMLDVPQAIDLASFGQGTYLLKIVGEGGYAIRKISLLGNQ